VKWSVPISTSYDFDITICAGTIESEVRKTNGKIERLQETLQGRMNLLFYTSPDELRRTISSSSPATIAAITRPSAASLQRMCPWTAGRNLGQEGRTETTHDGAAATLQSGPLEQPQARIEVESVACS
jgi:hypothetical protein